MSVERTFGIIKPDAVANGHVGAILAMIKDAGFKLVGLKQRRLAKHEAEAFYAVHAARPFYAGLVTFMTEGPVVLLALEREDAIAKWRELMGPKPLLRRSHSSSQLPNCFNGFTTVRSISPLRKLTLRRVQLAVLLGTTGSPCNAGESS